MFKVGDKVRHSCVPTYFGEIIEKYVSDMDGESRYNVFWYNIDKTYEQYKDRELEKLPGPDEIFREILCSK